MKRILTFLKAPYRLELLFWTAALIIPAFIDPASPHFSFCLFKHLGLDFCPGCGLGRSMAFLYRGEIIQSFICNPLGMAAIAILPVRIITLFNKMIKLNNFKMGGYHA